MKKVLIIGASELQLPAILKAKELGYTVGVVDYNPDAIGIKYSDKFYNVSTIDCEGVYQAAKEFNAQGIITLATDMPMRSLAYTCERLFLPGIDYDTALRATDKGKMIEAFEKNGVSHPSYIILDKNDDIDRFIDKLIFPLIIKPTDNSGSRGVVLVNDETELTQSLQYSRENSRNGCVILEEFMVGKEVSVEIIVINGTPNILQITDKLTTGAPHFVEMGHSQPTLLSENVVIEIQNLAAKACKAIGIINGPAHAEIIVTEFGPKMVEIGARMGGDCITTDLLPLSTGIDMTKATIDLALGEIPDITRKIDKASAIRFFYADEGIIKDIVGIEEANKIAGVKSIKIFKSIGDIVKTVENSSDRVGAVISQADSVEEAVLCCEKALKLIRVVTISS